jgi:hypothetical protein
MGLRTIAEQDLAFILEGDEHGFRWAITVTDPAGNVSSGLYGFSDDVAQLIDPDTGQAVSGRLASAAIRIGALAAQVPPMALPQGIADASVKPWLVQFDDINGTTHIFKVAQSNPDRALGLVTCILEVYTP